MNAVPVLLIVSMHAPLPAAAVILSLKSLLMMIALRHRLGTCLLGLGRSFEAEKLLQTAAARFTARLGADNPVASEARLALAVANVRQLLPFQV